MHRRIQAALLRKVTDLGGGIERMLVAEDAARSARRVDDSEQDPEDRRLARAIGSEQSVDRPCRHREADAVDRARLVEILDEVDRFDGIGLMLSLSKH